MVPLVTLLAVLVVLPKYNCEVMEFWNMTWPWEKALHANALSAVMTAIVFMVVVWLI
jgi:hypothetical protein